MKIKNKKLNSITLLCLSFCSFTSNAAQSDWTRVTQISTGDTNSRVNIQLEISPSSLNPANCAILSEFQVAEDQANRDDIMSLALSAMIANRQVKLTVADSSCANNRVKIRQIVVQ